MLWNLVFDYLPENVKSVLNMADLQIISRITELRLRRGGFVAIVIKNTSYFIDFNGDVYSLPNEKCLKLSSEEFEKAFMKLCSYSVYNRVDDLKKGFITLPFGARVGISSTAVSEKGRVIAVKQAQGINIRIPQEVKGAASKALNSLYSDDLKSIIVAGAPNSGKTTLLRDLARRLSSGFNGKCRKVCIIDERNEFAGKTDDSICLDIGVNTDVLTAFPKAEGIEIAARTLSPEIIICDEISTEAEAESIMYAFSSGIQFALSVHIGSKNDIYKKSITKKLIDTGEFSNIVYLNGYSYQTEIINIS